MIRISFKGRLGNQMFQYALMQAYKKKGIKTVPELSFYEGHEEQFELSKVFSSIDDKTFMLNKKRGFVKRITDDFWFHYYNKTGRRYDEQQNGVFDKNILNIKNGNVIGYWQSEKYFIDIEDDIREIFKFKIYDANVLEIGEKLKNEQNSVAIHVRRSDYLNDSKLGGVCTLSYYNNAIAYIREKLEDAKFYIFSDDIEWCEQNFSNSDVFYLKLNSIKNYQNWYDMYLMSCCQHSIIANSTFSWWSAWINNAPHKIVVAPDRWAQNEERPDIYCNGWIKISGK